MTALADGGWVVTWTSNDQDPGYFGGIYQQRYNADGSLNGSEQQVNTYTDADQSFPSVTALTDGGWVVTWTSNGNDGSGYGIYEQRYNADGSPVTDGPYGGEHRVNTYTGLDQLYPSVTALADGGWVVTWTSNQDGAGFGIYQQRYSADGLLSGSELQVNTFTAGQQWLSSVTTLADGSWVVTWQSAEQNGAGYGIYQQRFSPFTAFGEGKESGTGTSDHEVFQVRNGGLEAGDRLVAGGGIDVLQMIEAGTLDLTAPDTLTGIEIVQGSNSNDTIVTNTTRLTEIVGIQGGSGHDELRLQAGAYDFSAKVVSSIEAITLLGTGTLTFADKATALLAHSQIDEGSVILTGDTFTLAERGQLFRQGIHTITDADGSYAYEALAFAPGATAHNVAMTSVVQPFADAVVSASAGLTVTATITLSAPSQGRLVNLSGGTYNAETGTYTITGDAAAVQAALRALSFDPTDRGAAIGSIETTSFSLTLSDGITEQTGQAQVDSLATNLAPGEPYLTQAWVQENTAAGTAVGDLFASDPNPGDGLHFELIDSAGGRFALSGNQVIVANGQLLDYEQGSAHQIVVRVIDEGGTSFDQAFTIAVGDVPVETLSGTSGSNVLTGGAGQDRLYGGLGKDTLTGGGGQDVFVFNTKPNAKTNLDRIMDFNVRDDAIWLENAIFKALGKSGSVAKPAALKSSFFYIGAAAHDSSDHIIYNKKTGALYYDADGTGSTKQVQIATLSKKLALSSKDFFVI